MESEENKYEIIISNETKSLASFSSTNLIVRGQKLADLVLFKSPLLDKINNTLLGEFSRIGNNKHKSMLFHKIHLAIALLEVQNKSLENWATNMLYEELEKPENPDHIFPQKSRFQQEYLWQLETQEHEDQILRQKGELLQTLFKAGKQKIASEYALEKTQISWNGKGFPILFEDNLNIFSDAQMRTVVKILGKADEDGKHLSIDEFLKYRCKQREVISYFQDLSENSTDPSLRILACESLVNLGRPDAAQNALTLISSGSDYFAKFAKFLLGLTVSKQEIDQSANLLLDIIQKETKPYWSHKYNSYLPKVGRKDLAITTFLNQLSSSGFNDKKNTWKYIECINELMKLNYKGEDFLDKLINLSIDNKANFWLGARSFLSILKFEDISESQSEKLLTLAQPENEWYYKITASGVLANFQRTEQIGVDMLIRYLNEKMIFFGLSGINGVFTQSKRLSSNLKFLKFLYDLPNKRLGTSDCITIIKMLKKAEQ